MAQEIVSFGEWVQARRNQLGLSRASLARQVGCSPVTIKKIERDERRPSVQIAELLATHLQIPTPEQANFIRRARGEFVTGMASPNELQVKKEDQKASVKHHLPSQPTPFVGREAELASLNALFSDPNNRLITIVGPGGMGKTRLAVAFGERIVRSETPQRHVSTGLDFSNGVFFVPLAPLSDPDHIVMAMAEAFDLPLEAGGQQRRSAKQQVFDYLREKQMLLILDNFEHLLAASGLVNELLEAAPKIKIIVTSRERLNLRREQLYLIQGLEFPNWETPEDAAEYTAVKLFIQSALRVQHDFALTTDDLTYLSRICRLVGGMPLGVELAAGWVDTLPLSDIAAELQTSLDFLETTLRDVPMRHRSLRLIFDASWQRMSSEERAVFPKLSIFRGGFTRNAAQIITETNLRTLGRLASKSLLQFDRERNRYQIHELLRQYSAEKLAEDEEEETAVRDKHSAYYCQALAAQADDLKSGRQQKSLNDIKSDLENARLAWQWAAKHQQVERIAQAMESFGYFHEWTGRNFDGEQQFAIAAAVFETEKSTLALKTKAILLGWQSCFTNLANPAENAVSICTQALQALDEASKKTNDVKQEKAFVLYQLGRAGHDYDMKKKALEESLDLYRMHHDDWGMANALQILGKPDSEYGTLKQMKRYLEECLILRRRLNDQRGIAHVLGHLSQFSRYRGNFADSRSYATEAVQISSGIGSQAITADCLFELGMSSLHYADFEGAIETLERCEALSLELGDFTVAARARFGLDQSRWSLGPLPEIPAYWHDLREDSNNVNWLFSVYSLLQGDFEQGLANAQQDLAISQNLKLDFYIALSLSTLALLEERLGAIKQAQMHSFESAKLMVAAKHLLGMQSIFVSVINLLAEGGQLKRAIEINALSRFVQPYADKSWYWDEMKRPLYERIAHLPSEEIEAARERGRQLDYWQTAETLLQELADLGWGANE